MWLIFSLFAMLLLVARRSTEKSLADKIPSSAMAWLQQLTALPFMFAMLPFAIWYNPFALSSQVQILLVIYALLTAAHLIMYFKAIQVGDISIIAPLLNLTAVTSIFWSTIFLSQKPSAAGIIGAILIVSGAYLAAAGRKKKSKTAINNKFAVVLTLIDVILLGFYTPIEVTVIRETNVIYFNFISSLLVVPVVLLIMLFRQQRTKTKYFSKKLKITIFEHKLALTFIGLTMALNLFFTYWAKSIAPNAGYVTAIKGAQVVPLVLAGVFLFKEQVTKFQWIGVSVICFGLLVFLFS
jgi:transporter family protein